MNNNSILTLSLILCILYLPASKILNQEDYTLHFDKYLFDWDTDEDWHIITVDNTTKCTPNLKGVKQTLCVHTKSKGGFTLLYNNIELDFLNDDDWSEINTICNWNTNKKQHRRLYHLYDTFPMPALIQMGNYNPIIGKLKDRMAGRLASGAWRDGYYSQYRGEGKFKGNKFGGRGGYGGHGHGHIPGMQNDDDNTHVHRMGSQMMNPMARMMMKLAEMDVRMKMMYPNYDYDHDNDNAMDNEYGDYYHTLIYNRRRLLNSMSDMSLKKCVPLNGIEICAMYNVMRNKLNVNVKYGHFKKLKKEKTRLFPNTWSKMIKMSVFQRIFGGDHGGDNNKEYEVIEGNIGYSIWREEVMDWHNFENEKGDIMDENDEFMDYGKYSNFGGFVHYFDTFEFNWNRDDNMGQKCGHKLPFFNFKLCSNITSKDITVFFKKINGNKNNNNDIINYEFEHSLFSFNNEDDWHEIITSYHSFIDETNSNGLQAITKRCNVMYIAKLCLEFDPNVMELKLSIQFQIKSTYKSIL